jgi:predicted transcriptional regulator
MPQMTIRRIKEVLEAEELSRTGIAGKEINTVCGCDLMSDVLTLNKPNGLLLTGLTNPQVIRTVEMADIAVVCFIRGKKPQAETIELAKEKNIPLLVTKLSMFESCGRLYAEGIRGSDNTK